MKQPGKMLAYLLVTALVTALCWSFAADHYYVKGYDAGVASVQTPMVEEGRVRWVETDRDTLACGIIIYEIRDLVWDERVIMLTLPGGEPIFAVVIDPRK